MIYKDNKEIVLIYYGKKAISEVYRNGRLLWQAIKSCFGNGYWINEKPYLNDEAWKNNF